MVEAMIPEFPPSVWTGQAAQAPQTGEPNSIRFTRIEEAEVLLFYDGSGILRGILKYFEKDVRKSDQFGDGYLVAFAGEVVVIVEPDYRRRGIGTTLLREAIGRWNIDLGRQHYTPSGAAFVDRFQQDDPGEVG